MGCRNSKQAEQPNLLTSKDDPVGKDAQTKQEPEAVPAPAPAAPVQAEGEAAKVEEAAPKADAGSAKVEVAADAPTKAEDQAPQAETSAAAQEQVAEPAKEPAAPVQEQAAAETAPVASIPTNRNGYPADMDWALNALMVPHSAIRLAMKRLEAAVKGMAENPSRDGCVALQQWYLTYCLDFIHHHHDIEENDWFGWVQSKFGDRATVDPVHSVEHKDLMALLDKVKEQLAEAAKLSENDTESVRKFLKEEALPTVIKLADDMHTHLDSEEHHICPLLAKYVTLEENGAKEQEIVASLGIAGAKLMLPVIYDSMSVYDPTPEKKFRDLFWGNVPPPLRFFCWASWTKAYETQNKGVIESLAQGVAPSSPVCGF